MLISFPVGKYPGVGWLAYVVDLFLDYWRISILSFIIVEVVYIRAHSELRYLSTTMLPESFVFWFLHDIHCKWIDMKPHCCVYCISLSISDPHHCFQVSWSFRFPHLKIPVHVIWSCLNWIVCYWVPGAINRSRVVWLYIHSPILSYHFILSRFLLQCRSLLAWYNPICLYFLYCLCFWNFSQEVYPRVPVQ